MKKRFIYSCILILSVGLSGCLNVNIKHASRKQYVLNVPIAKKLPAKTAAENLEVTNVTVVPQFGDLSFVYRKNNNQYISDYYNTFMTPPANQVKHILINYLGQTGLFHHVSSEADFSKPDYLLHAEVLGLYADYQNKAKPKAVVSIRFILAQSKENTNKVLMNRVISYAAPLNQKNTTDLVRGWDVALSHVLSELTIHLHGIIND